MLVAAAFSVRVAAQMQKLTISKQTAWLPAPGLREGTGPEHARMPSRMGGRPAASTITTNGAEGGATGAATVGSIWIIPWN